MTRPLVWWGAALPAGLLLAWEALWHWPATRMESLSRPVDVLQAGRTLLADGSLWQGTLETAQAAGTGFAIGAMCGVLLGTVLGLLPRLDAIVSPSIDAIRPVPSVALIPVSLMVFGFGLGMEASVVAFACVWPVLLATVAAVRHVDARLLEVARALQLGGWSTWWKILLPAAADRVAVGLRLSLGIAIIVAVTVEIVINPRGLGHAMMAAQQALRFDAMYALLLWIGLLGWAVNALAARLLRSSTERAAAGSAA